ncbi:MAG: HRDC domain-containing protein [Bifidobacteriaceae bacterium]|jgi:ribonuclease D|nr:HRDC domain-containing protein [Bifidobacteriaceae bacterium]
MSFQAFDTETASVVPLAAPPDGLTPVVDTPEALARAVAALAAGQGPVAADSERASGFRYGSYAQLVQLYRRGTGLVLIDAVALPRLETVAAALSGAEWVFHAASQDLPCLREVGLNPSLIFDTELGARLLGWPQVGLAGVVARTLGIGLAKQFSAQDWSRRPLPESWLNYAALDVVLLLDVRDAIEAALEDAGKADMARAEFAAVLAAPPPVPRPDPWRRTSGLHNVRDQRQLAVVRELWEARDALAQRIDLAPGKVLPDAAIVAAATTSPATKADLAKIHPFGAKGQAKWLDRWWDAINRARNLPRSELPSSRGPRHHTIGPARSWANRHPEAYARMEMVKAATAALSEERAIPVENLMQPELLRLVVFEAPADVPAAMLAAGARPWQVELLAPVVEQAIAAHPG